MLLDAVSDALVLFLSNPMLFGIAVLATAAGIVMGALPGVSSTMALAILLPLTFGMEPEVAIMLLLTVLVASVFGGSISAILLGIPGTPGAIVTQFDGYPMAQQKQAGKALSHALVGSTVGGLIGVLTLMPIAPLIADLAQNFRSPEFAMLALLGLVLLAFATDGAMLAGLLSGALGLILGMVGIDLVTGYARYDFGQAFLQSGIHIVPLTIGVFGITEVLTSIANARTGKLPAIPRIETLKLNFSELRWVAPSWLRGSAIGAFIGAIPAAGSAIAVALAYTIEQRFTKDGGVRFGKGQPRGIAAPEAANSALTGGSTIPLITLGIPGDPMTAILIGALIIHGLTPGPAMFAQNPGIIGAIYGAILLAIVLTFVIGMICFRGFVQVMKLPPAIMMVAITLLCMVGAFAIRNNFSDLIIMLALGGLGYLMIGLRIPVAPLVFGVILGPLMEENLRRSLIISRGEWTVFLERPVSLGIIVVCLLIIGSAICSTWISRAQRAPIAEAAEE